MEASDEALRTACFSLNRHLKEGGEWRLDVNLSRTLLSSISDQVDLLILDNKQREGGQSRVEEEKEVQEETHPNPQPTKALMPLPQQQFFTPLKAKKQVIAEKVRRLNNLTPQDDLSPFPTPFEMWKVKNAEESNLPVNKKTMSEMDWERTVSRLSKSEKKKIKNQKTTKQRLEERELASLSFKPEINPKSRQISKMPALQDRLGMIKKDRVSLNGLIRV